MSRQKKKKKNIRARTTNVLNVSKGALQTLDHNSRFRKLWKGLQHKIGGVNLGTWCAVFGLLISILTLYHTVTVDEKEGKLNRQLVVSIAENAPLNNNFPTYFFFSMPEGGEDARYLVPIHLNLTNASNAHDNKVNLSIEYKKHNDRRVIPNEVIRHHGRRPSDEMSYEISSTANHDIVKYKLDFLSGQDSQSFSEGAFSTRMPYDPEAPILFNAGTGFDVLIHTYSEQDIPRDWAIRYRGLRVPDDKGIQYVMKEWYAKQLAFEIRKNSTFWEYFVKLIMRKEVMMYGFSPDFRFVSQFNTYVPTKMPNVYGYKVEPYSWKLLID